MRNVLMTMIVSLVNAALGMGRCPCPIGGGGGGADPSVDFDGTPNVKKITLPGDIKAFEIQPTVKWANAPSDPGNTYKITYDWGGLGKQAATTSSAAGASGSSKGGGLANPTWKVGDQVKMTVTLYDKTMKLLATSVEITVTISYR